MKFIRSLLLILCCLGLAAGKAAAAESGNKAQQKPGTDFLFVQTAKAMTFDKASNRLTLIGVSPVTLFFSERPDRIAGNMETAAFIPFWSRGKNSFLSDPPNADVSVLKGERLHQTVVLLRNPSLEGANLVYTVEVQEGQMPTSGENITVFIDVIGMPLTPLSFADAHRRAFRRAVLY